MTSGVLRLWRHWRDQRGSATVEFVILFPLVFSMLMMGVEAGYVATQRITLERGMDVALRDVRLGHLPAGASREDFRARICEEAFLLKNCEERLLLEMRVISTTNWQFPSDTAPCIDLNATTAPATPFTLGAGSNVMYLRGCYLLRPMFPTTQWGLRLPLDTSGLFALRSTTGFVNE